MSLGLEIDRRLANPLLGVNFDVEKNHRHDPHPSR